MSPFTPSLKPTAALDDRTVALLAVGIFKSCVGTAVLSMPQALSATGIFIFPVLLFSFAFLSWYGCVLVAKTLDIVNSHHLDPVRLAEISSGPWGKFLTLNLVFFDAWLSVIAFISTVVGVIIPLLESSPLGAGTLLSSQSFVTLLVSLTIFPFMLSTKITEIDWVNVMASLSLCAFTVGVFYNAFQEGKGLHNAPLGTVNFQSVVSVNVIAFAFDGCQMNMFPFYRDMPHPPEGRKGPVLSRAALYALVASAACYLVVAVVSFATYREDTRDNILHNYSNSPLFVVLKLAFAFSMLFTIPLILFECTAVLREHLLGDDPTHNAVLNSVLLGSAAVLAVYFPSIYAAFAYVGATTATAWTLILPPFWFICTVKKYYGDADSESDLETLPLLGSSRGLPPRPTEWEMNAAHLLVAAGILAIPIFLYVTVVTEGLG